MCVCVCVCVIYKLIHAEFKIQEIVPSRLANLIIELVLCTRLFIGFANLSGNISCILNSGCVNHCMCTRSGEATVKIVLPPFEKVS